MPKVEGVLETALYVKSVKRSARFYIRVFDFKVLVDDSHRLCALDVAGRQVLLLFKHDGTLDDVPMGGGYIPKHYGSGKLHFAFAITKKNLKPWLAKLKRLKIKVLSIVTWPPGGKSVYFHDPDGHVVELVTPGIWKTY